MLGGNLLLLRCHDLHGLGAQLHCIPVLSLPAADGISDDYPPTVVPANVAADAESLPETIARPFDLSCSCSDDLSNVHAHAGPEYSDASSDCHSHAGTCDYSFGSSNYHAHVDPDPSSQFHAHAYPGACSNEKPSASSKYDAHIDPCV